MWVIKYGSSKKCVLRKTHLKFQYNIEVYGDSFKKVAINKIYFELRKILFGDDSRHT